MLIDLLTNTGKGDGAFIPMMIDAAKKHGFSPYVGQGANLFPAVHVEDAAVAYRLALTTPPGAILHPAEGAYPTKQLAEIFASKLGIPTKSITTEESMDVWGGVARIVNHDGPVDSAKLRALGWTTTQPTLIDELENGVYKF